MRPRIHGPLAPLSDLEIERYLVGDLDVDATARIEQAIASSPKLAAHVAQRRDEQAEFRRIPSLLQLERRTEHRRGWSARPLWGGFIAAAATAAVVLWATPNMVPQSRSTSEAIRARGGLKATLTVLRDGELFELRDGLDLRAKDRLRVTVESASGGYVAVLAKSAHGQVSVLEKEIAAPAGTFTVPGSLELDDDPEAEDWVVLLTPQPVSTEVLAGLLEAGATIEGASAVFRLNKGAKK